jgi:hypothetical protein
VFKLGQLIVHVVDAKSALHQGEPTGRYVGQNVGRCIDWRPKRGLAVIERTCLVQCPTAQLKVTS